MGRRKQDKKRHHKGPESKRGCATRRLTSGGLFRSGSVPLLRGDSVHCPVTIINPGRKDLHPARP